MRDEKPVIAVDGRGALRDQRDFEGEYLYHLLTELGFMSRPYDLHVFGDLTADPEVLRRLRMILPVDLLITPNFLTWDQMAFPQAMHGAALVYGVRPLLSRIPAIVTLFKPLSEESSAYRRFTLRRALSKALRVVAASEALKKEAAGFGIESHRIVIAPAGVRQVIETPHFPKEDHVLVEPSIYGAIEEILASERLAVKPLISGSESERQNALQTALVYIGGGSTAESAWNRLLAKSSGCPVVEASDSSQELLAAVSRLQDETDHARHIADQGLASATRETWRKMADTIHQTFLSTLQDLHLL